MAKRAWLVLLAVAAQLLLAGCEADSSSSTSVTASSTPSATSAPSTQAPTSTSLTTGSTSTTVAAVASTERFSVPVGMQGVTYQVDGDPPSGPSAFAVLADGSVVIADTLALDRGEPRLLHFDRTGALESVLDLEGAEVAAIADVVTDGSRLAILDIYIPMNRYRVLYLEPTGNVVDDVEIPDGYHLEDGLTGLAWDDVGVLLEFEFGATYARVSEEGVLEPGAVPVFDGMEVEVENGQDRLTRVTVGGSTWTVERSTDLGGGSLVGLSPDESLVLVLDEVDSSGPAFAVTRRVQRYTLEGELLAEAQFDPGEQAVEILRPFELGADGTVIYLAAREDHVEILPVGEVPSG